ncbi:MAG: hypothetical protein V2A73_22210, partial [Pseudomonadota bacterium]
MADGRPARAAELCLARRAAYRRVLAVVRSQSRRFVVSGSLAVSVHLGFPVEGVLELLLKPADAAAALAAL